MPADVRIRQLEASDPPMISAAFAGIGWNQPAQYQRYLEEQAAGIRECWVALKDDLFAGYVTLLWEPSYTPLREAGIPEIQDLNVLPDSRRAGYRFDARRSGGARSWGPCR
jgi:hypothetical protein